MQDQNDQIHNVPDSAAGVADHDGGSSSELSTLELQRRGDVHKCPVCGLAVDAEAYHCPTCRAYFCYHCRARLLKPDAQLQCTNQDCQYYGKLVCGVCDPQREQHESPAIYAEPEDGYWPAWLALVLIVGAVIWYYASFWWAFLIATATYAGGGYLIQRAGWNLFGSERRVELQRKSTFHTCVSCHRRVKKLKRVD